MDSGGALSALVSVYENSPSGRVRANMVSVNRETSSNLHTRPNDRKSEGDKECGTIIREGKGTKEHTNIDIASVQMEDAHCIMSIIYAINATPVSFLQKATK